MTRKDFQLIADVIARSPIADRDREIVARDFAYVLRVANPQFDRERFLRACGVEGA